MNQIQHLSRLLYGLDRMPHNKTKSEPLNFVGLQQLHRNMTSLETLASDNYGLVYQVSTVSKGQR